MHDSWFWIKQRPHFIAENLNNYFNVSLYFSKLFKKDPKLTIIAKPKFAKPYYLIPFQRFNKYNFFHDINDWFVYFFVRKKLIQSKIIWITHPKLWNVINKYDLSGKLVIYDCCDDFLEFDYIKKSRNLSTRYYNMEKEAIYNSNIVLCSAKNLAQKLKKRHKISKEILIFNNAINDALLAHKPQLNKKNISSNNQKIVYLGTISSWFDFDLIIQSLKVFDNIEYKLIGPSEITNLPEHEKIEYKGPIEHSKIFIELENADILVMPFKVNNLIKSVNPVKIYEYILAGKPIICCYYKELNKFNSFVKFYKNFNDYCTVLTNTLGTNISVNDYLKGKNFCKVNTWQHRVKKISSLINEHLNDS